MRGLLFFLLYLVASYQQSIVVAKRSILRPHDPCMPELITHWEDEIEHYHLQDHYLEMHPIFGIYNKEHIVKHLLPQKEIPYRHDKKKTIDGVKLCRLVERFAKEVADGKTKFKHFSVLKRKDFNYRTRAGNLVVKCTKYPVIVKLFVEQPESFIKPHTKGWQTSIFYCMGGGINRFLSGFTRIENLEHVQRKIDKHPYWKKHIALPRKWFWIPKEAKWFTIESSSIGNCGHLSITVPSTYAIIADAIDIKLTFSKWEPKQRKKALSFCRFIGNCIDPHIDNFVIENKTKRICIVDTEHFASMVGLKKNLYFDDYTSWYIQLMGKYTTDRFFTPRKTRLQAQQKPQKAIKD